MDNLLKLVNFIEKGLNKPWDFVLVIIGGFLIITPLIIGVYKIISFNNFDRLLLPKHERNIQQSIVKAFEYLLFVTIYGLTGSILLFIIFPIILKVPIGSYILISISLVFLGSLIIVLIKLLLLQIIKDKYLKIVKNIYDKRFFRYAFNINIYCSFVVFAVLLSMMFSEVTTKWEIIISVMVFPIILLLIYRLYNKKYHVTYICKVIVTVK